MRRNDEPAEIGGGDSFLDVVANLVGILLILVVVVGVFARGSLIEQTTREATEDTAVHEAEKAELAASLAAKATETAGVEIESAQLRDRLAIEQAMSEAVRRERDSVQLLVTAMERDLEAKAAKRTEEEQQRERLLAESEELAAQLADLADREKTLTREADPVVLHHLPTPLAKTVFGREVHFRLQAGRLVHIPYQTMIDQLQADAPKRVWKLRDGGKAGDTIHETLGPVDGFLVRYILGRSEQNGYAAVELLQVTFVPVSEPMGEPIEKALTEGSDFLMHLRRHSPESVTVTLWVYPDSFADFRRVRERLTGLGYLSAGRPLPEGTPIGASPGGTRSAAQ